MNVAIFTIVRNEKYFLPIWLRHYCGVLEQADIYIIDNGTTDGSTDNVGCPVIFKTSKTAHNARWMLETVKEFQKKLLERYDYVVFAEADELIFHRHNELFKYIKYCDKNIVRCDGYDVKQILGNKKKKIDKEPEINLENPLLSQRKRWYSNTRFCKSLIARVPVRWDIGFHLCKNHSIIDKDIVLAHLHKLDIDLALKRNLERMNITMDKKSQMTRKGWQNFLKTKDGLEKFWETGHNGMGKYEDIPDWIKKHEMHYF